MHRLGPVLPDLGPGRALPDDPARRGRRRARRSACSADGKRAAAARDRGPLAAGQRRGRAAAGEHRGRRHDRGLHRRVAQRRSRCAGTPLRLQTERPVVDGVKRPNRCLADFVAPKGVKPDYIGLFAVTAGMGVEKKERAVRRRPRRLLGDHAQGAGRPPGRGLRRAAAPARAHRVLGLRAPTRRCRNEELIAEKYRGIRPAPGYPACPDHSVKRAMFERAAGRRDRHGPDREPGDDAGGQRQRLLPGAPARRRTSTSGWWGRIRCASWRSGRGSRWTRRGGGWRGWVR
ncbi:MAG: hypothetical protein MZW92_66380 [Comamonadaceae bacterium]|nr:hypothetical protein [Comamonadaceae bacterium]